MKSIRIYILLNIVIFWVLPAKATEPLPEGLFVESEPPGRSPFQPETFVIKARCVTVRFDELINKGVGDSLNLNLFPDEQYLAVVDRVEVLSPSMESYTGHLHGVENSQFVLVTQDGQMAGDISMPGAIFQVRYGGEGIHRIRAIDQSILPPEAEPVPVYLTGESGLRDNLSMMADDGSRIDVMVVYTPATRAAAGGTTAVQNLVNLAVVETNQSYANSGIIQRLNLVYTGEIAYNESGDMYTDLIRLTNTGDGYLDYVHSLRETYRADIVSMFEESSQYCGISWLMTYVSLGFASNAFNVVASQCATGNYTFGHELGHNMGARHDWYVDDTLNSPYSYNKGYLNVPDRWRTIMSYNSECSDQGLYCTRLPYWSNPEVFYGGDILGVPVGTSTSCQENDLNHPACDADNRRTLNNTAYTVANFRSSGSSGTVGPLVYESLVVDDDSSGTSQGNGNGEIDCGETVELYINLRNLGDAAATGVSASISSSSPHVSGPLFNSTSGYTDIIAGGIGSNIDDFDFSIHTDAPQGYLIHFDLNISAYNSEPWSDSFEVLVNCAEQASIAVYPNPLVSMQAGDSVATLPLEIHNQGGAQLVWEISEQAPSGDGGQEGDESSSHAEFSSHTLAGQSPAFVLKSRTGGSNYSLSDADWVSINPISGITPAGEVSFVFATFESDGLAPGTYSKPIFIFSNDPEQPVYPLSVEILVDSSRFFLPFIQLAR